VGRRFAARPPAAIVSSDMARAYQTAQAISQATGIPVIASPLLGERNFGDLRGKRFDDLDHDPIHADAGPPNGESMDQFRARIAQAYQWILEQRAKAGGDLAVVSHGLFIRHFLLGHTQFPEGLAYPEHLANTSVTIVAAQAPHTVSLIGCSAHLDGAVRDDGKSVVGV
jgi:broad specificity phosphatase PhoE